MIAHVLWHSRTRSRRCYCECSRASSQVTRALPPPLRPSSLCVCDARVIRTQTREHECWRATARIVARGVIFSQHHIACTVKRQSFLIENILLCTHNIRAGKQASFNAAMHASMCSFFAFVSGCLHDGILRWSSRVFAPETNIYCWLCKHVCRGCTRRVHLCCACSRYDYPPKTARVCVC